MVEGLSRGTALNGIGSSVEVSSSDVIHEGAEESRSIDGIEVVHVGISSPDFSQKLQPDTPAAYVLGMCFQLNSLFLGASCASPAIQEVW